MTRNVLLCIDDEPTGLSIRKLVLESVGYQVITAGSGAEGLHVFNERNVDAVVLDFYMPGLDGGQVAKRMRQLKPWVPILLLSAYVSLPEEVITCVDAYVTKGQPPAVLLDELSILMRSPRHFHPELAGDYVAFVDCDRRYIEVSDALCELLGYARAELLGKRIEDVAAFATVRERFQNYVEVGQQEGYDTLRHRDGSLIPIRYRAKVFPDGCVASIIEPLAETCDDERLTGTD
jgi:PAS domain S-box-containing protein